MWAAGFFMAAEKQPASNLDRSDRRLDVVHQCIRQAETTGQHIQISAFGPVIRVYCKSGSRIKLDLLFLSLRG